jgi:hypothetical protein
MCAVGSGPRVAVEPRRQHLQGSAAAASG